MMSVYLLIAVLINGYGYSHQIYLILKNKQAIGVSYQAYLMGAIAATSLILNSENETVMVIYIVNLMFSLTIFSLVFYYNHKDKQENFKTFLFSGLFSLFGVYGMSQAIKTFKNKTAKKMNVSLAIYGVGLIPTMITIYFATSIVVLLASISTLILNFYVAYKIVMINYIKVNGAE